MRKVFPIKHKGLQNRVLESAWPAEVGRTVGRLGSGFGATRRPSNYPFVSSSICDSMVAACRLRPSNIFSLLVPKDPLLSPLLYVAGV